MKKYIKKIPDTVEVVTFDEFLAIALALPGTHCVDGVPWSFTFWGRVVTHETDDEYTLASHESIFITSFVRGDLLVRYPWDVTSHTVEEFEREYELVPRAVERREDPPEERIREFLPIDQTEVKI